MAAIPVNFLTLFSFLALLFSSSHGQLSTNFYATTCPNVSTIVRGAMTQALNTDSRIAASFLRLFFHDCFVNGCDASILLDDTTTFTGEKNAGPNAGTTRGYEVVDTIKSQVEASCSGVVSCADILALATRDGVVLVDKWIVPLGRRDARTASQSAANSQLPGPSSTLAQLITSFSNKGFSAAEMTVLSGSHTIGQAGCASFRNHIYNQANIDPAFATTRRANCPSTSGSGDRNLAPLDVQTPIRFENAYFQNLVAQRGLLNSDQVLFNNGSQDALVRTYSQNNARFLADFVVAMVKMGNISPASSTVTEIRRNCRRTN
ncbi:peroxidase P7-like [Papaver somniferum]|uniref:peroxidase P7-like n=1 Tax=Papaver somniferum TaxID=3469 RepID=UPI000E7051A4|nr:peroxidase P7-like [Papaver somniferum]